MRTSKKVVKVPEAINCVAILGDREVAVMGGDDKKLIIWNLKANEQVGDTFDGHEGAVTRVAVTPDGKRVVSALYECTMKVWDVGSHQQIASFCTGNFSFVECVAVSEDGRRIISGSMSDNKIRVSHLKSRKQICEPLEGHTDRVTGVSFLPDAVRIVSSSGDGTVRVWDVTRANRKETTSRHKVGVSGVSFTYGKFVVSASWDKTLRIWNTTSGKQVGDPLRGHSDDINDVAVTPNGKSILSVSDDKTLRVWDCESRQLLHTLTGHIESVQCVAVTRQGDRAVTGSSDNTVRAWDLAAMDGNHFILEGHNADVKRVFVSDDGLRIISVDNVDNIFVWELQTKKLAKQLKEEDFRRMSRREVLNIVGETTVFKMQKQR